jgi:phosphate:Na+ symporter
MPVAEALMNSLAGLGLLFFGIKQVTRNLSAMTGDRLRTGIANASKRTSLAIILGTLTGFAMQSGRTASLVMASFVQADVIGVRQALPIVLWANLGCTLIIFAAIFPIHFFVLLLLAIAGSCVAFERPKGYVTAAYAVFGLALMLFGLEMMSSSAAAMTDQQEFAVALAFIRMSLIFAFLAGLIMTVIAQSHMAITLIAVATTAKGLFDVDQAAMVIAGAHAGSAINTYIAGVHFRGRPLQIILAQALYNVVGIALFLMILVLGYAVTGQDMTQWLTRVSTLSPGANAAAFALLFNFLTPLLLTVFRAPYRRLCARLAPTGEEEALARPKFLRAEASASAVATLTLSEREQVRLLKRMPGYCAALREELVSPDWPAPAASHAAFQSIGNVIERSLRKLMTQEMTAEDTEWLLNQQKRLELLASLDEACFELWQSSAQVGDGMKPLRATIVETLDTLLLYAIDAAVGADPDALTILETMTRNHGLAMERIRKRHLPVTDQLTIDERNYVLLITSIFERAAWTLRRFGKLLGDAPILAEADRSSLPQIAYAEAEA